MLEHTLRRQGIGLLLIAAVCVLPGGAVFAQNRGNSVRAPHRWAWVQDQISLSNRVNAHGEGFNAVIVRGDEKQLLTATEKGEVLVWGIFEKKFVRRFGQGTPVHALALLPDGKHFVAAGGKHAGALRSGVVRLWSIERGTYDDLAGAGNETIVLIAVDREQGLIAAALPPVSFRSGRSVGRGVQDFLSRKSGLGYSLPRNQQTGPR